VSVIVTGGAGAIGRAIAARLHGEGHPVLLADIAPSVADVAGQLDAAGPALVRACVVDLSGPGAAATIQHAASDLGPIQLLVNNAGITRDGRALDLSDADFRTVVALDLIAPLRLVLELAPNLADSGAIVNIASRAGLGNFGQANYVAAKAGLIGATRSLALRLAPRLRVNAVAPGLIDTPMTASMPPEVLAKLVAKVPLERAGEPADVAAAVAFLASAEASYVTGQTLVVCGGRSLAA